MGSLGTLGSRWVRRVRGGLARGALVARGGLVELALGPRGVRWARLAFSGLAGQSKTLLATHVGAQ